MKILLALLLWISPIWADAQNQPSKMKLFKMVRNNQIIFKQSGPVPQVTGFTWDNSGDFKKIKNPIGDILMFDLKDGKMNSVHEVTSCWTEQTCRHIKSLKFNKGKFFSASRCTVNRESFQWKSNCETVTANLCEDIKKHWAKMGSFEKCVPVYDDERARPGCPALPKKEQAGVRFELAKKILQKHEREISGVAIETNKLVIELAKSSYAQTRTGLGRHLPAGAPVSLTALSENSSLPRHLNAGEYDGYMWGLFKANSLCHDSGFMPKSRK